ncbi:MAG TPA: phasin family protein [Beijerinckiaceae bacterium]|jgi:hypothetical protein
MSKEQPAKLSRKHDEPGNGPDPFSFTDAMLDFQRQFFGFEIRRGESDATRSSVSDPLEMMSAMLSSCTQMLGATALANETMRFVTRQAQLQVEYMQALRDCRNWAEIAGINMEFTRRIAQDTSDQLRELADAAQRLLAGAGQSDRRGLRH